MLLVLTIFLFGKISCYPDCDVKSVHGHKSDKCKLLIRELFSHLFDHLSSGPANALWVIHFKQPEIALDCSVILTKGCVNNGLSVFIVNRRRSVKLLLQLMFTVRDYIGSLD
jgi:hypothetical protein